MLLISNGQATIEFVPHPVGIIDFEYSPFPVTKIYQKLRIPEFAGRPIKPQSLQVLPPVFGLAIGWHDPAGVASATLIGENAEWETEQWHTAQVKYDGLNKNLILGDHFHLFALKTESKALFLIPNLQKPPLQ